MKILVDIDGTIADTREFMEKAWSDGKNWDEFLLDQTKVSPMEHPVTSMIDALSISLLNGEYDYTIVFFTARYEKHRDVTLEWLWDHGYEPGTLLMRPDDSSLSSYEWKHEVLENLIEDDLLFVFDDDPRVIERCNELGIGSILIK